MSSSDLAGLVSLSFLTQQELSFEEMKSYVPNFQRRRLTVQSSIPSHRDVQNFDVKVFEKLTKQGKKIFFSKNLQERKSYRRSSFLSTAVLKKNLNLGLIIPSTFTWKRIIEKSKKKFVKFLVLEKKFIREKKLNKIKKKIYFYTIKDKKLFNKFNNKNLIFENL